MRKLMQSTYRHAHINPIHMPTCLNNYLNIYQTSELISCFIFFIFNISICKYVASTLVNIHKQSYVRKCLMTVVRWIQVRQ
jgi:hypothetical protein